VSEQRRHGEAQVIEAKFPGWAVLYGPYTQLFWAFGSPDGVPITAPSASELLGLMRAAERFQSGPYCQTGSPVRRWPPPATFTRSGSG
jgi:hypothetical protein